MYYPTFLTYNIIIKLIPRSGGSLNHNPPSVCVAPGESEPSGCMGEQQFTAANPVSFASFAEIKEDLLFCS